jgi:hypothetical protein
MRAPIAPNGSTRPELLSLSLPNQSTQRSHSRIVSADPVSSSALFAEPFAPGFGSGRFLLVSIRHGEANRRFFRNF